MTEALTFIVNQNPAGIAIADTALRLNIPVENILPSIRNLADSGLIRIVDNNLYPA